ncbi:MAG: phospho-N-acetylmuramoyl-pentapeptide-transferase [Rickettsiaceae bacterium]
MLYNLLLPHINTSHFANLFHYITFRSGLAVLLSLLICFIITPFFIKFVNNTHKFQQPIREHYTNNHQKKIGTPTMGGIVIIGSILFTTLLLADIYNTYILLTLFVAISFCLIGFIDDYIKITKKTADGISAKVRIVFQLCISLIACAIICYIQPDDYNALLTFPFVKKFIINLGYFYIFFGSLVIIGSANAVNLTDGLDGLAILPIGIAACAFGLISYLVGHVVYSQYLQINYIENSTELTVLCAAIFGSSLGFLWFNSQPAEIFMGDTGSLSLGAILGVIAVIIKHEIVLAIIGGLFVIETLSVILQVYYFKLSNGKRIFKMAPLHHHFEQIGWTENKIVIRFWIIAIIFTLVGLSSLKLR